MSYEGLRSASKGPCAGLLEIVGAGGEVLGCTHGPDPAPADVSLDDRPSTAELRSLDLESTVPCVGNGTDGFRVQAIYAYPSTLMGSRFSTVESAIQGLAATEVDAIFGASAAKTGGDRDVRFVHNNAVSSCEPTVIEVAVSPSAFAGFSEMVGALRTAGYNSPSRKYLVWMDEPPGTSSHGYCGIAQMFPDEDPTIENFNNGHPGAGGMFARTDAWCWGDGAGTPVEAHELMHNLGGVQNGSPNTSYLTNDVSPGGHCTDNHDVMCYDDDGPGPVAPTIVCSAPAAERLFDCGNDDYFSLTPPGGSYLGTYWNAANNRFIGGTAPPAPAAPANDSFSDAQVLAGSSPTATGTNLSATKEAGEPAHASSLGGRSVWYRWEAPDHGAATFSTAGSSFDTLLGVYTGTSVGSLSEINSNDDANSSTSTSAVMDVPVTGGTIYRIAVDGWRNGPKASVGAVDVGVDFTSGAPPVAPPNDAFSNARVLSGTDVTVAGTNVDATKESGEDDHAGDPGGASVWYRWQAPSNGTTTIDLSGSDFDTLLAVYTGSAVGSLTEVASNDDLSPGVDVDSRVDLTAASGTTYRIAVDGYRGDQGDLSLELAHQAAVVTRLLSVTRTGTGGGGVASSPAGINCGTSCSASFPHGTSVALTATPASGSAFGGWGGACSGSGACVVTMDAAKTVSATFVVQTVTLPLSGGDTQPAPTVKKKKKCKKKKLPDGTLARKKKKCKKKKK